MSIASEILRIQNAKANILRALSRKGIQISEGATLDDFAEDIDPLTAGEEISYLNNPQGYLSFKFITNGTVRWQNKKGDIEYSTNGGSTWTSFNGTTLNVQKDDEIWFRGSLTNGCGDSSEANSSKFITIGKYYASGNILSLCSFNTTLQQYHFAYLFKGCVGLNTDLGKQLLLPAITLAESCYCNMFSGCTSLITTPELPATTLANECYSGMFDGCISLTIAPELPATTLAEYCYSCMFDQCASLTSAPELPATTLAESCYNYMFSNCASLITAPPKLPATTLANECYSGMFEGCTSLIIAPELPATTLANECYSDMFFNCTSLTTPPELPATTLAYSCYRYMFQNCTSLTTAPELPATTLALYCYYQMFQDCTSLNYIKCLATDISASDCTYNWVNSVASSGTFVKDPNMSSWTTGESGIPNGWSVVDASN